MSQQYQRVYNAKTITGIKPSAGSTEIFNADILPNADVTFDLGSSEFRWQEVYTNDLIASNNINAANQVNSTTLTSQTGSFTSGNNATSKTDTSAAVRVVGGVAIGKRCWADAFQADTEMRTTSLVVTGSTTTNGNVNITGTLGVAGATSLSSLSTSGNTTIGGTLGVTGATNMSSLTTSGNTTVGGSLGVTGTLTAAGTTVSSFISNGSASVGGALLVQNQILTISTLNPSSRLDALTALRSNGGLAVAERVWCKKVNADQGAQILGNNADIQSGGLVLHWNRSSSDGESWILNQKGGTTSTNTGIRFGSITTGNVVTEWMRIIENGNVGIGTTNPTSLLHIVSPSTAQFPVLAQLLAPSSTGATQSPRINMGYNGTDSFNIVYTRVGASNDLNVISFGHTGVSDGQFTISRTGNVGINTSTPSHQLHVVSTSVLTGTVVAAFYAPSLVNPSGPTTTRMICGFDGIDSGKFLFSRTGMGSDSNWFSISHNLQNDNQFTITRQGLIGIGTVPNAQFQLSNTLSNRKIVLWENANNDHQFYGFGINSSVLRYQIPTSADHIFYSGVNTTSSTELMRITSTGRVGIRAPSGTVRGNLHVSNGSNLGNVVIEAGNTSDGLFSGWHAINFNGFYNGGEQRFTSGKNRWRIYVDQSSTNDRFAVDTFNGTTTNTPISITTGGLVSLGYSGTSLPTPVRQVNINNTARITGNGAVLELGDDGLVQIYRFQSSQECRIGIAGNDRLRVGDYGAVTQRAIGIGSNNTPIGRLHLSSTNDINNIIFEAGTTSDGLNSGHSAINFNGYHNLGELRVNSLKSRWRLFCDQKNTIDRLSIDLLDTTNTSYTPISFEQGGIVKTNRQPVIKRPRLDQNIPANVTYTVSAIVGGIIHRNAGPVGATDTVASYSDFVAAGYGPEDTFILLVVVTSSGNVVVNPSSGGTAFGSNNVNSIGYFMVRLTTSSNVDLYRLNN